jgi:integrase
LFIHCAQLVLAPFFAFSVWVILRAITSAAATLRRVAVVVWLVFFSAYDSLAGIGTGVLVGGKGAVPRTANWSKMWRKVTASVGMQGLHFHDLRHTGNTLAASTGASTEELMARMATRHRERR